MLEYTRNPQHLQPNWQVANPIYPLSPQFPIPIGKLKIYGVLDGLEFPPSEPPKPQILTRPETMPPTFFKRVTCARHFAYIISNPHNNHYIIKWYYILVLTGVQTEMQKGQNK